MSSSSNKLLSHFEEKAGCTAAKTEWGRWYQTVHEIHIEIELPTGTRAKDLKVVITPTKLECSLGSDTFVCGKLHRVIKPDESTWTIEERRLLRLILCKGDFSVNEGFWKSLLQDEYKLLPEIEVEMRKVLDLERFQMEYPGMDFSRGKLAKCYKKEHSESSSRS